MPDLFRMYQGQGWEVTLQMEGDFPKTGLSFRHWKFNRGWIKAVTLYRPNRGAFSRIAVEGVGVSTGDGNPQAVPGFDQHRGGVQVQFDFGHFTRNQGRGVGPVEAVIWTQVNVGRRFVRNRMVDGPKDALGDVGHLPIGGDIFQIDVESAICLAGSHVQGQDQAAGNFGINRHWRAGIGEQFFIFSRPVSRIIDRSIQLGKPAIARPCGGAEINGVFI